jgi:hypothetical protein
LSPTLPPMPAIGFTINPSLFLATGIPLLSQQNPNLS